MISISGPLGPAPSPHRLGSTHSQNPLSHCWGVGAAGRRECRGQGDLGRGGVAQGKGRVRREFSKGHKGGQRGQRGREKPGRGMNQHGQARKSVRIISPDEDRAR